MGADESRSWSRRRSSHNKSRSNICSNNVKSIEKVQCQERGWGMAWSRERGRGRRAGRSGGRSRNSSRDKSIGRGRGWCLCDTIGTKARLRGRGGEWGQVDCKA